jgi:hypothetical protein
MMKSLRFEVWGVGCGRFDTVPVLFCVETWSRRRRGGRGGEVQEQGREGCHVRARVGVWWEGEEKLRLDWMEG